MTKPELKVYAIDGIVPVVDPTAYVHPSAILIGDVIIGPGCYVGPCASLRGDFGRLILERGANVQDTCVMHGFPGTDTVVYFAGIDEARFKRPVVPGDQLILEAAIERQKAAPASNPPSIQKRGTG